MIYSENRDYFDFSTKEEEPEEHSGQNRPCPHCHKPVPADSLFCLYCGKTISSHAKSNWAIAVTIIALVAFILWIAIL